MVHKFNAPFVFHTEVKNHKNIKQQILPEIKQNLCPFLFTEQNVYTSYNVGFDFPKNIFENIVLNPFQKLTEEYKFNPRIINLNIEGLWWNYYLPGGYTDPHTHREDDFSFIYLLELTGKNTTMFRLLSDNCFRYPFSNLPYSTEHITEGNVIIFPSFLVHWVRPCYEERAVIVGNIKVDF